MSDVIRDIVKQNAAKYQAANEILPIDPTKSHRIPFMEGDVVWINKFVFGRGWFPIMGTVVELEVKTVVVDVGTNSHFTRKIDQVFETQKDAELDALERNKRISHHLNASLDIERGTCDAAEGNFLDS